MHLFPLLFLSCLLWMFSTSISSTTTYTTAKPGCATTCGNVTIPYPFGIIQYGYSCSLNSWYDIDCTTSKPTWGPNKLEVVEISQAGQMRIKNTVAHKCYNDESETEDILLLRLDLFSNKAPQLRDGDLPIVFSDTANEFSVLGCDDLALVSDAEGLGIVGGCFATCSNFKSLLKYNGSCSGIGCCQTPIPKGFTSFIVQARTITNYSRMTVTDDFNPCSHAFLGEKDKFTFNVNDLSDPSFVNRTRDDVPIVLEWVVGVDETCNQAQQNIPTYACQHKTTCTNFDIGLKGGYRCSCLPGYEGNPYLIPGCTDIDECAGSSNPCTDICTNTPGSFICSCPKGREGDGLKSGIGCTRNREQFIRALSFGVSFGFLFLLILVSWIFIIVRRRKVMKIREKLFEQNEGLLLKQQLSPEDSSKLYTVDQLKTATNNYSEDRFLGTGGFGNVYWGILDGREVAIKKPKLEHQNIKFQVQDFRNEVAILMKTNHKNVVKLLGCCLETNVPILVYEYVSNGTLLEHIKKHSKKGTSWLNWENCIRVATEIADAFAYLHSAAFIIHSDIKSANILLDKNMTPKIADFGTSKLVPIGQSMAPTDFIRGTVGYMDPVYSQDGLLTMKSDVYSFGVVLAELLTKEKVISEERSTANLAMYFISSMRRNRLLEILDTQLVKEASEEQLLSVGKLVLRCLDFNSENRPTMREIANELDALKTKPNHPWVADDQSYSETTSFVSQPEDLYPASSIDDVSSVIDSK